MWHDVKGLNTLSAVICGIALLLVLGFAGRWLAQRPAFNLHQIQVESAAGQPPLRRVNVLTVRSVALPRIKGNFFTVNLDTVKSAFEAVPWVRRASVRRAWPDRLVVSLEEFVPVGLWGDDGRLLSNSGEVFTANQDEAEEDGSLLQFSGPVGSEGDVRKRLDDFTQWFAPLKLKPVEINLSDRYAWSVRLDNGMRVELGREQTPQTLHDRVERLVRIFPELTSRWQDRIESVDLRYANGLALKASDPPKPEKPGKKASTAKPGSTQDKLKGQSSPNAKQARGSQTGQAAIKHGRNSQDRPNGSSGSGKATQSEHRKAL